jgi:hypothetical protein
MTGAHGQASVEWAGLLALAAVLGATLALIAGPPLADAIRAAIVAALSESRPGVTAPAAATAADIADVQSALASDGTALTPDAALIELGTRHGAARAVEIADALLLATAREHAPWLGRSRTYHPWTTVQDGLFAPPASADGDHDVETPTGPPAVSWVTVAAQRDALVRAFAHHTDATEVVLSVAALVPGGRLVTRIAQREVIGGVRSLASRAIKIIDGSATGAQALNLVHADDGGVPGGMRAGDVEVEWPVHRTAWRDGQLEPEPLSHLDSASGAQELRHDYEHVVYLRPVSGGLAIVGEEARPEAG